MGEGLLGFAMLGAATLLAVRLVYGRRRWREAHDVVKIALTVGGWLMLWLGLLGCFLLMHAELGFLVWIAVMVVAGMSFSVYRTSERRSLLSSLAIAAERGVPLDSAARAFAQDRSDVVGRRARTLADALSDGESLPAALVRSNHRLTTDATLAVIVGWETGTLAPALRRVVEHSDYAETTVRNMFEKLFYLVTLCLFGTGMVTYVLVTIVPRFSMIFLDFGLALPASTEVLVTIGDWCQFNWPYLTPIFAVLLLMFTVSVMHYLGWLPRNIPLVGRLMVRCDAAWTMWALSLSAAQGRSIAETLRLLSVVYPKSLLRKKLHHVVAQVDQGGNWAEALRSAGLATSSDVAVFQSAERAGNLAWALDEMSDSTLRRFSYRLRAWHNVLFPLALLMAALVIMFIVVSLFLPIFSLILQLV